MNYKVCFLASFKKYKSILYIKILIFAYKLAFILYLSTI